VWKENSNFCFKSFDRRGNVQNYFWGCTWYLKSPLKETNPSGQQEQEQNDLTNFVLKLWAILSPLAQNEYVWIHFWKQLDTSLRKF